MEYGEREASTERWDNHRRDYVAKKRRRTECDAGFGRNGRGFVQNRHFGFTMPETNVDQDVAHAMKEISRREKKSIFQVCRDAFSYYLEAKKEEDAMFQDTNAEE